MIGTSAWIASCLTGCAHGPDPLRAAYVANDAVVAALEQARANLADELEAEARQSAQKCKPLPPIERLPCTREAVLMAYDNMRLKSSRLSLLVLIQHGAADAIDTAAECRRSGTSCEAEQLAKAEAAIARVRSALVPGGGR